MRFFIAFGFLIFSCAYSLDILCQKHLEMQQESLKIILERLDKNPSLKEKKKLLEEQIRKTKRSCNNESILNDVRNNIKSLQEKLDAKSLEGRQDRQKTIEKELLHRELIAAKMELLELEALLNNP